MKVLFIGGTGIISSACSRLALEAGHEVSLLNRGESVRMAPAGAEVLHADMRCVEDVRRCLEGRRFDVIAQFIGFTPADIERDLELFSGVTGQYVFISSASAYQKPPAYLPITESTLLRNPVWEYSRAKIACEERLIRAYREQGFPVTIIRPSHTYDRTLLPSHGGWTVVDRMRKGLPVVVHGDGSSLWVLTHHRDFARGFVPLLGLPAAIGEAVHITSDEVLTWDRIYESIANAAGVEAKIVHVPSEIIARFDREWGDSLLGDKTHSVIFDNSKLKRFVPGFAATIPFSTGVHEIIEWYDEDPSRRVLDTDFNRLNDTLVEWMTTAGTALES